MAVTSVDAARPGHGPRRLATRWESLEARMPLPALLLFVAAVLLISPWGDFPLNDDWQYARIARHLALTGHFVVDMPIAPALVGQSYFAWPFLRLFGFSHVLLRLLVLGWAAVLLWLLDRMLALGGVSTGARRLATIIVALNPLYLNLSCSYMSEVPGYAPALVGAWIWFRSRRRADDGQRLAALSTPAALMVGALCGLAFWTRQFAASVFPAIAGATVLELVLERAWQRLRQSLLSLLASGALFVLVVAAYFWWARATGHLNEAFVDPLAHAAGFDGTAWESQTGIWLFYMTLFFAPLLAAFLIGPLIRHPAAWLTGAALLWAANHTAAVMFRRGGPDMQFVGLHRHFPFVSNVLYNIGVGPLPIRGLHDWTTARPLLAAATVQFIQWGLTALAALWALPALRAAQEIRNAPPPSAVGHSGRRELLLFASLLTLGSLAAAIQAYGDAIFDRYYFPCVVGLALFLGLLVDVAVEERARSWRQAGLFLLLISPLSFYSVAGMHDYFRWNEVRWRMGERLVESGVDPSSIDGGYEWNGWMAYDAWLGHHVSSSCIGECHCQVPWEVWHCRDDSYRIGVQPLPGYEVLSSERPRYWLYPGPPLSLTRRRAPRNSP